MKNILLIAFDFNPDIGSEARFAYFWAKLLKKHYNVYVITDVKHKENLEMTESNFRITYCSFVTKNIRALLDKLRAYNVLYKLFIRSVKRVLTHEGIENIDLIHCLTPAGCYTYNNLYKLGKPILLGPLGGGLQLPKYFKKYKSTRYKIRQIYYKLLRMNLNWQNYYKNCLNILIGTPNLLLQLPQSTHTKTIEIFDTVVDTNKFIPGTQKNSDYTTIMYSGRMDAFKGCVLLLEAFKLLLKIGYTNIQMIMLGDGPEFNKMLKIVKDGYLEKYVKLVGNVSIDEVNYYLKKADIFCLPSVKEAGGTAILEAMACALPVITADHGGPAVSVTAECGIKIKPSNYDRYLQDLTDALAFLIDNKDIREKMGLNARNRAVNEYSYEVLEIKIKNLYDSLFEGGK